MNFSKNILRTRLDVTSPERIKRIIKDNGAMKYALVYDGTLLSSSQAGVPLGEFVSDTLISLGYIEEESDGFVFVYPLSQDEVIIVIKKEGIYLVDDVVPEKLWRLTIFDSDASTLFIVTTGKFIDELKEGSRAVLFEHDLLNCGNRVGVLQPVSSFTKSGLTKRMWSLLAGVVAVIAVYFIWFDKPPPQAPVDHYADYRNELSQQTASSALKAAVAVLVSASELDSWNVDKLVVVPGQITVTLGPVADSSPIKEVELFAKKYNYGIDFVGSDAVLSEQLPLTAGNPNIIYDLIKSSISIKDAITPDFTFSVRFGGFVPKPRYSSVDMHITGDAILLDDLVDISNYLDEMPVMLDKIELSRPSDGIEFIYNVDLKSRIIGEVREHG